MYDKKKVYEYFKILVVKGKIIIIIILFHHSYILWLVPAGLASTSPLQNFAWCCDLLKHIQNEYKCLICFYWRICWAKMLPCHTIFFVIKLKRVQHILCCILEVKLKKTAFICCFYWWSLSIKKLSGKIGFDLYLLTYKVVFLYFHETTTPYKHDHSEFLAQYRTVKLLFCPKLLRP